MALSKNAQEKSELFKALWQIACEVRGSGVTGWDFKSYILDTLFYRYISEMFCNHVNNIQRKAGSKDFDYAKVSDKEVKSLKGFRESMIGVKGFFLYPSELFCNVAANADKNENLNTDLDKIFKNIEASAKGDPDSERCFSGLFNDFDVNSEARLGNTLKKRNEKLTSLLKKIAAIDFGGAFLNNDSDVFGDAYEYLMGMYASDAGQKGGEFFTPQEVTELLTKICVLGKKSVNRVYDLTCGSGSLLLKPAKLLGEKNVKEGYYGQEVNSTTYNLCRMNMILHDIPYKKFNIACGDTLMDPQHWDFEPFEVIVSNPPYSVPWKGDDDVTLINDPRFQPAGVLAPKSKADFAFIMHTDAWLAPNGVAAIVCFPGIMYRSGAEQKIRQYLIDNNRVDAIIHLPGNLFYGTNIETCIMVLKKNKIDNKVLFIDATKEFVKETNQNRLSSDNMVTIMDLYVGRKDVDYKARLVGYDEIVKAKYNLSVSTYVEKEDTREVIDIDDLNTRLDVVVSKENQLRADIQQIIKEI